MPTATIQRPRTILAIDLGKFKSVACDYDSATAEEEKVRRKGGRNLIWEKKRWQEPYLHEEVVSRILANGIHPNTRIISTRNAMKWTNQMVATSARCFGNVALRNR